MASHHPRAMDLRQSLIRSCSEEGIGPRAVPFKLTSFSSFQVSEAGRTYQHGELAAGTLEDAIVEALARKLFDHKDHLVIREQGERGVRLHVYAIKRRSAPRYVHRDHVTRRVNDLYPAPICVIDGGVLL